MALLPSAEMTTRGAKRFPPEYSSPEKPDTLGCPGEEAILASGITIAGGLFVRPAAERLSGQAGEATGPLDRPALGGSGRALASGLDRLKVAEEPVPSQFRHLLQRAGFLEEMGGSRHDLQPRLR